jgi:hypothetical protein
MGVPYLDNAHKPSVSSLKTDVDNGHLSFLTLCLNHGGSNRFVSPMHSKQSLLKRQTRTRQTAAFLLSPSEHPVLLFLKERLISGLAEPPKAIVLCYTLLHRISSMVLLRGAVPVKQDIGSIWIS